MNRDAFLAAVSAGIVNAHLPREPDVAPALPPLGEVDLVELFRARAQSINTVVHGPVTRHDAPRVVTDIASDSDTGQAIESFVAWSDLPAPGIPSAMAANGWTRVEYSGEDDIALIAGADLGITGSSFGLAESGSVVLSHGPGRGRLVSLLPPVHVALLQVDQIHRTLAHWAAGEPGAVAGTANLVIVSGPSRTGDIELELKLGVHGPKHVHVILVK
jgi:L-lactate dehydrogenase complex protein LldG